MTERYEWIDNARVIAALLIMYVHLPNYLTLPAPINHSCLVSVASNLAFSGRIPFFLILAGYFLARNISWKKAWNRFLWLFIPYALWNLIASGIYDWVGFERLHEMGAMSPGKFSWLGIGSIFSSQLGLWGRVEQYPIIGPSWFLRDIMLLTLLTPFFVRIRRFIPAIFVLCATIGALNLQPESAITISLGSCLFYGLGVWFSQWHADGAYRVLRPSWTPMLVVGILLGIGIGFKNSLLSGTTWFLRPWNVTFVGVLFGVWMIAQSGFLIEHYLPKLSKRLAPLAPACFMVFMLHMLLYDLLIPLLPDSWRASYWGLLIPFPIFALISAFFLAIKHWAPCLLPYLAHMRLPAKQVKQVSVEQALPVSNHDS